MLREILERRGYFSSLSATVKCADRSKKGRKCGYCRDGNWFICELCDRSVPWCFGGAHKYPDYCDSCYCQAIAIEEPEPELEIIKQLRKAKLQELQEVG